MDFLSPSELQQALLRAEASHAIYEKKLGYRDEAWARYYAFFIFGLINPDQETPRD